MKEKMMLQTTIRVFSYLLIFCLLLAGCRPAAEADRIPEQSTPGLEPMPDACSGPEVEPSSTTPEEESRSVPDAEPPSSPAETETKPPKEPASVPEQPEEKKTAVRWNDRFVQNGEWMTDAPDFPEDYVFSLTDRSGYQSKMVRQNDKTIRYPIKKELFYAIKKSGKTVTLLDDCAAFIIRPEDVMREIRPEEFAESVFFGSCFRNTPSYPAAAREFACNAAGDPRINGGHAIVAREDQFQMGREFIFWQYNDFPNDILSGCEVAVFAENGGRTEKDPYIRDFDGLRKHFYTCAKEQSLFATVYDKGSFFARSSCDENVMPQVSPHADGESVRFHLRSGTGYHSRTYLLTTIHPYYKAETEKKAKEAEAQIDKLPRLCTAGQKKQVEAAAAAYRRLNSSQKALVANDRKLFAAELEIKIAAIPETITQKEAENVFRLAMDCRDLDPNVQREADNWAAFEAAVKQAKKVRQVVRIACVGDSVTKGSYADNLRTHSYPAQLQTLLGSGFEVTNFGVGGTTMLKVSNKPYWDQPRFQELMASDPDVLLIMLGTNDAKARHWQADAYLRDYEAMVALFRKKWPHAKIYLLTSPTAYENPVGIDRNILDQQVVPGQKKLAKSLGLPLVDVHQATSDRPHLFVDGVHANASGYGWIAKKVAQVFQD